MRAGMVWHNNLTLQKKHGECVGTKCRKETFPLTVKEADSNNLTKLDAGYVKYEVVTYDLRVNAFSFLRKFRVTDPLPKL